MSSRCGAPPNEYTNRRSKRSMPFGVRSCRGDSCTGVNSAPSDRVVSAMARSRSGTIRPVTNMSPSIAPPRREHDRELEATRVRKGLLGRTRAVRSERVREDLRLDAEPNLRVTRRNESRADAGNWSRAVWIWSSRFRRNPNLWPVTVRIVNAALKSLTRPMILRRNLMTSISCSGIHRFRRSIANKVLRSAVRNSRRIRDMSAAAWTP